MKKLKTIRQILRESVDPNSDVELIGLLNHALALEYGAIIQYYHNKAMFTGIHSAQYQKVVEHNIEEEIKHVEVLVDKIIVLGGEPTIEVKGVNPGNDIKEILLNDLAGEREALEVYYKIHERAKDLSLKLLIENIIMDEQEHYDNLLRLLREL